MVKRNNGARAGDALVLGKPLGVGIYSAALKKHLLDDAGYRALVGTTTQLNRPGVELARLDDVHALTDVTGFGLLGHLLEICRGSTLGAVVDAAKVPLLAQARALADAGVVTGASARNWQSYGDVVEFASTVPSVYQSLLTDPQTSGGLLVACAPEAVGRVLDLFATEGFAEAAVVGSMQSSHSGVRVL